MTMSIIRSRWAKVLWVLLIVGSGPVMADDEWGPFSGGGGVGQSSGSGASLDLYGSYEYTFNNPPSSSTASPSGAFGPRFRALQDQIGETPTSRVGEKSIKPRHGVDVELSLTDVEIDTGGVLKKEQTGIFSLSYVSLFRIDTKPVKLKFRFGGGLSYFNFDEAEVGYHLKAEVQIPLRREGNVGLMLGAVHFEPDAEDGFTVVRAGIRLHRRLRH